MISPPKWFLLLCSCLSACGTTAPTQVEKELQLEQLIAEVDEQFKTIPKITIAAIKQLLPDDYLLVDVRTEQERQVSMLPKAISLEAFLKQQEHYRDKLIIPYCTIGYRSALETEKLIKAGFQVKNLSGSILAWAWAGLPLLDSKQTLTKRVNVYGKKWAILPDGYESVY